MIRYDVLAVGYVISSFGNKYPAELVYDYELMGGAKKGLKVKRHSANGRYGNGWWFYNLSDYIFIPTTKHITLIGV